MILLTTVTAALCGAIYLKVSITKNEKYKELVEKYGEEKVEEAMNIYKARVSKRRRAISKAAYAILVMFPFEIIKVILSLAVELDTDLSSDLITSRSLEDEIRDKFLDNASEYQIKEVLKDQYFTEKEVNELLSSSKDTIAREIAQVVERKS